MKQVEENTPDDTKDESKSSNEKNDEVKNEQQHQKQEHYTYLDFINLTSLRKHLQDILSTDADFVTIAEHTVPPAQQG